MPRGLADKTRNCFVLQDQCGSYGATPLDAEFEAVGIEPDLEVESKIEWMKSRHDRILEKAIELAGSAE